MARLWFCFESHLLVVLCHNSPKESFCLFAYAFSSFCVGHSPSIVFFTVFAKSNLPNNTFKQVLNIMMKSSWGLNEFAVKHNSTGPSLWMEREKGRWVEMDFFFIYTARKTKQKLTLNKESAFNAMKELYYVVGKWKFAFMVFPPYSSWFCCGMVRNLIWPMVLNIRQ